MQVCFYPVLENSCNNVRHYPHLGGAAIEALVQIANGSGQGQNKGVSDGLNFGQ